MFLATFKNANCEIVFAGIRSVQVVGRKLGTSGEHPPLCHLVAAKPACGNLHRVLQQHRHHHPLPAHTGLNGTLDSHVGINSYLCTNRLDVLDLVAFCAS